jgi:hypothetical protein
MNHGRWSEFRAMVSDPRRALHILLATGAIATLFLVALPVALTLARAPWFNATFQVGADAHVSPPVLAATVHRLVRDSKVEQSTIADTHLVIDQHDLADRITTASSATGILIRVRGRTPAEARSLADALGSELSQAAALGGEFRVVIGRERVSRLGFVDRVVDPLPGAFPKRNGPTWVGFAGFVAAAIVCTGMRLLCGHWKDGSAGV